ncbi:PadR family transcriptional regulator PadR [Prauserella shujinwangii]|uniref:PadR family transcriptional regulator PadR n=1 Tax=Prauserella shujinwangii TaxID=1453103 RepID=A0A2T0M2Q2_9PSEU|nr:PadR family transcriptional regulator [Prauserella shujinwangii]PRX50989.1 PadR family transcriptional regulator PadR [Prauserella shujinwangii]
MTDGAVRHRGGDFCHPRGLLDACLLLLMRERPAHGYELRSRLARLGLTEQAPGSIYRALRRLHADGLARASWQHSACTGPDRRVYAITPEGEEALELTRAAAVDLVHTLDTFLAEYHRVSSAVPEQGRSMGAGALTGAREPS